MVKITPFPDDGRLNADEKRRGTNAWDHPVFCMFRNFYGNEGFPECICTICGLVHWNEISMPDTRGLFLKGLALSFVSWWWNDLWCCRDSAEG